MKYLDELPGIGTKIKGHDWAPGEYAIIKSELDDRNKFIVEDHYFKNGQLTITENEFSWASRYWMLVKAVPINTPTEPI